MRVADLIPVVTILFAVTNAQHGNHVIPEVDQIIQYMFEFFESWVNNYEPLPSPYSQSSTSTSLPYGNHTATSQSLTSTSSPYANPTASCSYWLDDIKHQGISAFNSDTDYTVFRNVKDYGAKGVNILFLCFQFRPRSLAVFHFSDGGVNSH